MDSGKGLAADIVLHIVFWARLCTFCIVLGLVTEAISSQVHAVSARCRQQQQRRQRRQGSMRSLGASLLSPPVQVRRGNHRVVERRHTVMLNWNKQTLPVLQQVRECACSLCACACALLC